MAHADLESFKQISKDTVGTYPEFAVAMIEVMSNLCCGRLDNILNSIVSSSPHASLEERMKDHRLVSTFQAAVAA